ncbi:MAG: S8 family serine peptidase [Bacteroidia bacterium]
MKLRILTLGIILLSFHSLFAQDRYMVLFTDKNNSPFSISNPQQFLSQRAIDRRNNHGIAVTQSDLPVNPAYVQGLISAGASVLNTTKWFNGAIIQTSDPAVLAAISALPYVQNTTNVGRIKKGDKSTKLDMNPVFPLSSQKVMGSNAYSSFAYGYSDNQINMLGLQSLHNAGFDGSGMIIAVLDAGFLDAPLMVCFDSLFQQNRIIYTWDFVDNESDVYDDHYHGAAVLSCMASIVPDSLIGTAPHAQYILLRSEDANTEYVIEEYNWAVAAEFADSAGADVINSSLGYTTFNDPSQDHTYADMNGNTAPGTIAADMAASKGLLVVNSAGNEGNSNWNYIGVPADGDSVLAVGAVDEFGSYAFFSSNGPSYDGRVKPDVAARGQNTWLYTPYSNNFPVTGNGTSFSSPVMAGAVACLWQGWPEKSNMEIIQAVKRSASQFNNPDTLLGYGIPNFTLANSLLSLEDYQFPADEYIHVFPNPWNGFDHISLLLFAADSSPATVEIYDLKGSLVSRNNVSTIAGGFVKTDLKLQLEAGMYLVRYTQGGNDYVRKLIRY